MARKYAKRMGFPQTSSPNSKWRMT